MQVLSIPLNATEPDVKRQYRKLAAQVCCGLSYIHDADLPYL